MKEVWAKFKTSGAQVVHGQIVYSLNVGQKSEESYILPAKVEENEVNRIIPEKATITNLILSTKIIFLFLTYKCLIF